MMLAARARSSALGHARPGVAPAAAPARRRARPSAAAAAATAAAAPPIARRHPRARRPVAAPRATGGKNSDDNTKADAGDSDLAYVAKLAALSFAGAAVIKYGSLLIALPHEPNLGFALAAVIGTPVAYGAWLLSRGGRD